jgi:lysozyme
MKRAIVLVAGIVAVLFWIKKAGASQVDSGGADSGNLFYMSLGKTMSGDSQTLSNAGLQALKKREGFSGVKYPDPPNSGKFSVGYGHQIQAGESYDTIDEATASLLLAQDVQSAENTVNGNVSATLTQNQFDALVSFVYNIGAGAFLRGSVPQKLNNGDIAGATLTMRQYINSGGTYSGVLVSRRDSEVNQFYA